MMEGIMQLNDGSLHTVNDEEDFYDLVEEVMGSEALEYLTNLIFDITERAEEEADEKFRILNDEYTDLVRKYVMLGGKNGSRKD